MSLTRPRMPYPPHTVLGDLRTSELFVVSCLRLWVHDYCGCTCGYPDWRDGFERAQISAAGIEGFDTVWRVVATTAQRALDLRPMYCVHLGGDEGQFLRLLCLLQHDQVADAEALLGDWCPASAARVAINHALAFALALRTSGLWMPLEVSKSGEAAPHSPRPLALHPFETLRLH